MNTEKDRVLAGKYLALRKRLQMQRALIAHCLPSPSDDVGVAAEEAFPRSMSMRLFVRRPAVLAALTSGVIARMTGSKLVGSAATAIAILRMFMTVRRTPSASVRHSIRKNPRISNGSNSPPPDLKKTPMRGDRKS